MNTAEATKLKVGDTVTVMARTVRAGIRLREEGIAKLVAQRSHNVWQVAFLGSTRVRLRNISTFTDHKAAPPPPTPAAKPTVRKKTSRKKAVPSDD